MNCEFSSSTQISFDPVQYQYAKMDCAWSESSLYFLGTFIFLGTAILLLKIFNK